MTKPAIARITGSNPLNLWDLQRHLLESPFFFGRAEDLGTTGQGPAVDIIENGEGFHLSVYVPGFVRENIQIGYENRTLTVSGERNQEEKEGVRYHRKESFSGRFQRAFTLPSDINAEKINAELKDGVLSIFLPKHEANKPRHITVKVG